jgi:hypothetical protein
MEKPEQMAAFRIGSSSSKKATLFAILFILHDITKLLPPTFSFDGTTKPNKRKRDSLSVLLSSVFFAMMAAVATTGSSSRRQYGRKNKSREKIKPSYFIVNKKRMEEEEEEWPPAL